MTLENYVDSCDWDFILHGINSISLIDRLEIPRQFFTEKEINKIETESRKYADSFRSIYEDKISSLTDQPDLSELQEGNLRSKSKEKEVSNRQPSVYESNFNSKKDIHLEREGKEIKGEDSGNGSGISVVDYFDLEFSDYALTKTQSQTSDETRGCLSTGSEAICETLQKYEEFYDEILKGKFDGLRKINTYSNSEDVEEVDEVLRNELSEKLDIPCNFVVKLLEEIEIDSEKLLEARKEKSNKNLKIKQFPFSDSEEELAKQISENQVKSKSTTKSNKSKIKIRHFGTQYEPQCGSSSECAKEAKKNACTSGQENPLDSDSSAVKSMRKSSAKTTAAINLTDSEVSLKTSSQSESKMSKSVKKKEQEKSKKLKSNTDNSDEDWENKTTILLNKKFSGKVKSKKHT